MKPDLDAIRARCDAAQVIFARSSVVAPCVYDDIPALLAYVEELTQERDALREEMFDWQHVVEYMLGKDWMHEGHGPKEARAELARRAKESADEYADLKHREVMLKRAHGALTDAGCVVPIEIDRTIEHAINALAQERDEERMRTRCFEQAMAEAQTDLEDTREALHATQSKSDYWRNEFRNERRTFQSCNRARQAAEDECAELRARVAELEARRWNP